MTNLKCIHRATDFEFHKGLFVVCKCEKILQKLRQETEGVHIGASIPIVNPLVCADCEEREPGRGWL